MLYISFLVSGQADTKPPEIQCPPDQTLIIPPEMNCNDNPSLTVTLVYPPAIVTDDSRDEVDILDYPANGTEVHVCTNQLRRLIMITATDSSGNSASCSFFVCKYDVNVFFDYEVTIGCFCLFVFFVVVFPHRQQCTVTLNSNFAILKT